MLSEKNRKFADDYLKLYHFSKEIGRNLSLPSNDAIAMGVKNAMHVLCQTLLSEPDAIAVALCDKQESTQEPERVPAKSKDTVK